MKITNPLRAKQWCAALNPGERLRGTQRARFHYKYSHHLPPVFLLQTSSLQHILLTFVRFVSHDKYPLTSIIMVAIKNILAASAIVSAAVAAPTQPEDLDKRDLQLIGNVIGEAFNIVNITLQLVQGTLNLLLKPSSDRPTYYATVKEFFTKLNWAIGQLVMDLKKSPLTTLVGDILGVVLFSPLITSLKALIEAIATSLLSIVGDGVVGPVGDLLNGILGGVGGLIGGLGNVPGLQGQLSELGSASNVLAQSLSSVEATHH
ncbi:hypothetical protein B0I72DRAFT_134888 [Yarrowia lipolytica]|uniref:YALI0D26466p n=2 Tax=Yarrowia lipolytica TaxID=4952 RepID=Q6C7P4_YARLI|nr:YALI0D26466p [Yarrowia lipolytica CLIB122]AOW04685.1 hypothetical protein YALI1_D34980g [Yarrowia lipolytica]KAB8283952.1 hypothetical protein BKA91DRAFT_135956 [Yarrowia lipolytica]KAE8172131.1 hypothetical protein BKA90DRAFT_137832 [Yarrowia lipolytica]KAJ8053893.1 hypothetical protein LXG23DRAFT_48264 [Yarrowia lipolytica]RDW26658.1 hypothetical protein B0I71DRAFT_130435 [Yarrowia lipolytica]|eukprot:XP_503318.1 YALI0D26466p [Yarrowia lipolytica CLIB122]